MIKNNILKIGDFGFAEKIPQLNESMTSSVGTPLYMSVQMPLK
jgi:hypothetical protein